MRRRSWILLPLLHGCSRRKGGEPEVRIAFTEGAWNTLPWRLAYRFGYFREVGVDVAPTGVPGSAKVMEALTGGSVEVALTTLEHVVQLAAEGRPTPGFINQFLGTTSPIVVSPNTSRRIQLLADLRGATLGVSAMGSQTHMIANYLVSSHGPEPNALSVVSIGFGAASVAALERGLVDAGFVNYSSYIFLKRKYPGLRTLFDPVSSRGVLYPTGVLCARSEWLFRNRDTARRISRAVLRALQYVHETPPEEIASQLPADLRSQDPSVDLEAVRTLIPRYSKDGTFPDGSLEMVKTIVGISVEKVRTARIDPRHVYTNEFAKEGQ